MHFRQADEPRLILLLEGDKREIFLLDDAMSDFCNIQSEFDGLDRKLQRPYWFAFESWRAGLVKNRRYRRLEYVGYQDCFVFEDIPHQSRIYGHLTPTDPIDPECLACTLVHFERDCTELIKPVSLKALLDCVRSPKVSELLYELSTIGNRRHLQ